MIEKVSFWLLFWGIFTYFWLKQELIYIFTWVMFLDFVFAIISKRIQDKSKVESRIAVKWLVRKIWLFLLPFLVVIVWKVLWWVFGYEVDFLFLATTTLWVLILQEAYSLTRHIYNISTGEHLPEAEVVNKILKKLWKIVSENADDMIEKKINEKIK